MIDSAEPILLGGYAAKQCPVRTHNDFAPLVPLVDWEPSEEVQADLDAGKQFESEVFDELLRIHPNTAVLVETGLRKDDAIAQTTAAMESATPLILGGWLPDDLKGGRKGKPDILVKVNGGYLPADVKHHKTIEAAKVRTKLVSSLARPDIWTDAPRLTSSPHHYDDGIQLAHYTRMLQACGFHPGEEWLFGAIVGTSLLAVSGSAPELVFVWHDLTKPTRPTFSRSRGKVFRSVLERYDHEHAFRLKVAATARRISGSADGPEPLVVPIGQGECGECPYGQWCADQMGPEDASAAVIRNRLDVREWQTLRHMGVDTTSALAEVLPDDSAFFDEYYLEVSHHSRGQARKRLSNAVRQARMICDGVDLEAITAAPIEVPGADIEVDFDIEWDKAARIYQWGFRVRDGQDDRTARYEPIVSFDPLDDAGEFELAQRAAARVMQLRTEAEREGLTLAIYHWHHVEVTMTRKFDCVAAALDGVTVDLLAWFNQAFIVRREASIKVVAQLFGFSWAVEDPGGRMSQEKIEIARGIGAEAQDARQWCLDYNESDVAAQAAIRDGIRVMFNSGEGQR